MARQTLTDRTLKSLKPAPAGKRYDIMDAVVPGLGIRVTDKGQRTFVLVARYPGSENPTRRALGEYGALTLEDARKKARGWIEMVHRGSDPKHLEERERQTAARHRENTFGAVAEDFIRRHVSKTRKAKDAEREIRKELLSRWATRPIGEITKYDVIAALDEIVDRDAPYQAHNVLGHARRLFNWAIGRGKYGIEHSPCDRLRPADLIGRKLARTRTLTDEEIRALWRAAGQMGFPFGPLFQMLLLTGQRKSEVAEASWSEFQFDKRLWTIPAERMKADAAHLVPMAPDVIPLLEALPRFKRGDFVFSTMFGEKPVRGFGKAKVRLDALMLQELRKEAEGRGDEPAKVKLAPWRIHDIRRTMRTHLSALPVPDMVRELVIAHTKPGLHKVYDQYGYLDEKREALELWAARLRTIVQPVSGNVVELRGRA